MTRALKIIRVGLGLLAGVVIALGAVIYFIDFNEYRGLLAERLSAAMGRPLRIDGDVKLRLGLHTGFSASGLTLGNGGGSEQESMAKIGRVSFGVALWPLLSQDIQIDQLQIEDAEILIERGPDGRLNWDLGQDGEPSDDGSQWSLPRIENLRLLRGRFVYRDGGRDLVLEVDQLAIHTANGGAATEVILEARLRDDPMRFAGSVDNLDALLKGQEIRIDGELSAAGTKATVKGRVFHPLDGRGVDLHVTARSEQVQSLLRAAGLEPVLQGTAEASLDLSDREGPLALRNIQASLVPAPGIQVVATGELADALGQAGLALDIKLQAADTAQLSTLAGTVVPALGRLELTARLTGNSGAPSLSRIAGQIRHSDGMEIGFRGALKDPVAMEGLDLDFTVTGPGGAVLRDLLALDMPIAETLTAKGRLEGTATVFRVDGLDLRLGNSDLQGRLDVDISGKRPKIIGELNSTRLDLDFLPAGADAPKESPAAKAGARLIPDIVFDLGALAGLDGELKYRAARLHRAGLELEKLNLTAVLRDGALAVRPSTAQLAKGQLVLEGRVDHDGMVLQVDLRRAAMATLGPMLDLTAIEGSLDFSADLRARGGDLRALAAGLNGKASVVVSDGRIDNEFLDLLAKDLVVALIKGKPADHGTRLRCLANGYAIKDGVAVSEVLLLDTENITVAGDGQVDLSSEAIRYRLVPKPKDPSLISLATPIDVSGSLAEPSFAPDTVSVAGSVATAVVGNLLLPGVGLLLPLLKTGTGEAHPCLDVVKNGKAVAAPDGTGKKGDKAGILGKAGGAIGEGVGTLLKLPGKLLGSE